MNERPVYFGAHKNLLGMLALPDEPRQDAPTVVLLNAGLLHRVGPNRLHVTLARRLASMGVASFRFDMSGVGDSEAGESSLLYIERSRDDVIEALDALRNQTGAERFVLMGVCTGAFNAFRAALVDARVSGCVLLDGYSYPTLRSRFDHYRARVLEFDRWVGYAKRKLGRTEEGAEEQPEDLVVFENEVVPRERFRDELAALTARGTRLFFIYTGLGPLAYTYEAQLQEAFPEIDLSATSTVRFYREADHTLTLPGNREAVIGDIEQWVEREFLDVVASPDRGGI